MNKKRMAAIIICLGLVGAAVTGGTLAYFTDTREVNNVITMGHVDILLEEPLFEAGDDVVMQDGNSIKTGVVYPMQEIIKDPTITVADGSLDCYLRVMITVEGFEGLKEQEREAYSRDILASLQVNTASPDVLPVYVSLDEAGWKLSADGYYYYCEPDRDADGRLVFRSLTAGDRVAVFSRFHIPERWDNRVADSTFDIKVSAEAIQADAFTPYEDSQTFGWFYTDTAPDGSIVLTGISAQSYEGRQ